MILPLAAWAAVRHRGAAERQRELAATAPQAGPMEIWTTYLPGERERVAIVTPRFMEAQLKKAPLTVEALVDRAMDKVVRIDLCSEALERID